MSVPSGISVAVCSVLLLKKTMKLAVEFGISLTGKYFNVILECFQHCEITWEFQ